MAGKPLLRATVDRIVTAEGDKKLAVLVFDDGQQLVVGVEYLPEGVQEKQIVRVSFELDGDETARRAGEVERLQRELFGDVD